MLPFPDSNWKEFLSPSMKNTLNQRLVALQERPTPRNSKVVPADSSCRKLAELSSLDSVSEPENALGIHGWVLIEVLEAIEANAALSVPRTEQALAPIRNRSHSSAETGMSTPSRSLQ